MNKIFVNFPLFCLIFLSCIFTANAQDTISPYDAKNYEGQKVTVIGTIVETYVSPRNNVYLKFEEVYPNSPLVAIIFYKDYKEVKKYFDEGVEGLINKKVKLTGVVKKYKKKPQIIINMPDQLQIIE